MEIIISENRQLNGKEAAAMGADLIRKAISETGKANIIHAERACQRGNKLVCCDCLPS
jgi:hypothetical protein